MSSRQRGKMVAGNSTLYRHWGSHLLHFCRFDRCLGIGCARACRTGRWRIRHCCHRLSVCFWYICSFRMVPIRDHKGQVLSWSNVLERKLRTGPNQWFPGNIGKPHICTESMESIPLRRHTLRQDVENTREGPTMSNIMA